MPYPQACNTCGDDFGTYQLPDGAEYTLPDCDGKIPMGSMIIMAGCTFYGFEGPGYGEHMHEHVGPQTLGYVPEIDSDDDQTVCGGDVNGFDSYKCRCSQKMIDCDPSDSYANVMTCENYSSSSITCSYTESIGTSYTYEASESMSVSVAVEETIQAGLADIFSVSLGISASTNHDWTVSQAATFETAVQRTVEVPVPGNTIVSRTLRTI